MIGEEEIDKIVKQALEYAKKENLVVEWLNSPETISLYNIMKDYSTMDMLEIADLVYQDVPECFSDIYGSMSGTEYVNTVAFRGLKGRILQKIEILVE